MAFEFHAGFFHVDDACRRLSFADRNDETGEHYFVIDRSEDSLDDVVPDMANVYVERDDQCWGGYGGIERVVLARDSLTLHLGKRMATQMGDHESIRVSFDVSDHGFREMRSVLGLIMRGYESRLQAPDSKRGSTDNSP